MGNKILTNTTGPQKIEIDKKTTLEVKCSVKSLSFSAHADAKVRATFSPRVSMYDIGTNASL